MHHPNPSPLPLPLFISLSRAATHLQGCCQQGERTRLSRPWTGHGPSLDVQMRWLTETTGYGRRSTIPSLDRSIHVREPLGGFRMQPKYT